jgi:catalase
MGLLLIQDAHLLEKLVHLDRERLPERTVHAKEVGCYLEITEHRTKEVLP